MTTLIQFVRSTGEITRVLTTNAPVDVADYITNELNAFISKHSVDPEFYYVRNNVLTLYPPRPEYLSVWDGARWQPDLIRLNAIARRDRDDRLRDSDWTELLTAKGRLGPKFDEWQTYRQALRDITKQPGFPLNIEWPTPPS